MKDHIVTAYDTEIENLNQKIADMATDCESQLANAGRAFADLDKELAGEVIKADQHINRLQKDIEADAVRVLAKRAPVAVDLRHLLSAMRIASEIERIADYAANIARRVSKLSQAPDRGPADLINDMAALCRNMLSDAVTAFLELETEKAVAVWERDDDVDRKFARMMRLVRRQMQDEANAIVDGTQLIFIGRCWERVGDHITNISEDIYYIKTGQNYIGSFEE